MTGQIFNSAMYVAHSITLFLMQKKKKKKKTHTHIILISFRFLLYHIFSQKKKEFPLYQSLAFM